MKRPSTKLLRHQGAAVALALVAYLTISVLEPNVVSAQSVLGSCPDTNGINEIPSVFCNSTLAWIGNALAAAQRFFFLLVGIEIAWSAIVYVLQKENLGEFLASFILKMMGVWFFYGILLNAPTWLPLIEQSFISLSAQVAGVNVATDPMAILNVGLNACNQIFENLPQAHFYFSPLNLGGSISDDLTIAFCMFVAVVFASLVALVIFVAFLIAAGQLIMTLIESYIMISAGAVMLGFMGSRWTMPFGEKFIGYAVSIGIKLFVTFIVIGLYTAIGVNFAENLASVAATNFYGSADINKLGPVVLAYLETGASSVIFAMLTSRLPGLAASMLNGSPSLTLGGLTSTASAIGGAALGVASAGGSAALGVAAGAAQGIGGSISAVQDTAMEAAGFIAGGVTSGGGDISGGMGDGQVMGLDGDVASSGGGNTGDQLTSSFGDTASIGPGGKLGGRLASNGLASVGTAVGAVASGAQSAVRSAVAPFTQLDEGGGGGTAQIGLKLHD